MKKRVLVSVFALLHTLYAIQIPAHHYYPPHPTVAPPWFTGPLLAPSALTVPPGHVNIQPYIYATAEVGKYNNDWHSVKQKTFWNNYLQVPTQIGITSRFDCIISPVLNYNYTDGAAHWAIGDLPISIDIQLYKHNKVLTEWGTALLLRIQEVFPIGKYRNLDPKKLMTDAGGQGSWQTNFMLIWGNLFYLGGIRFVTWRTSLEYTIPSPVHVTNLNAYGGGPGTNGTVYPGQSIQLDTALEVTLTQRWVFAIDLVGNWNQKTRFSGTTAVSNKAPASIQYSLAPALEYNWNASLGMIFGCWFTVAGKNSTQFISGVWSIDYFF